MSKSEFERMPLNADGGFYVVKDSCITCIAPHQAAPELMGMDEATGCYFRRQPQTAEELAHAVEAIHVSCIAALRYAGSDPQILEQLRARRETDQCDALSAEGDV